jgi:HORMA domain
MKEILIDFLEVITNQILYLRGLYPSQIFKKQKVS